MQGGRGVTGGGQAEVVPQRCSLNEGEGIAKRIECRSLIHDLNAMSVRGDDHEDLIVERFPIAPGSKGNPLVNSAAMSNDARGSGRDLFVGMEPYRKKESYS